MSVKDACEALVTLATGDVTIAGLIGTRFYPGVIPVDQPLPACAYQVISTPRSYHHEGQSSLVQPLVQITISANLYDQARNVAEALREKLSGYSGTVDGLKIYAIFLENELDGEMNLETEIKTVRQDYRVIFKEE